MANILGWKWALTFLGLGPLLGLYFVNKLPESSQAIPVMDS